IFENLDAGIYTIYAKDFEYSDPVCVDTVELEVLYNIPYKSTKVFTAQCGEYWDGSNTKSATRFSKISQEDADTLAMIAAKELAENSLVCTVKENLFEVSTLNTSSFTVSYSFIQRNWCIFHDYIPDFLFASRSGIASFKDNKLYRHNLGEYGKYY